MRIAVFGEPAGWSIGPGSGEAGRIGAGACTVGWVR